MRSLLASGLVLALLVPASVPSGASPPQSAAAQSVAGKPGPLLRRFTTDQAFRSYLRATARRARARIQDVPLAVPAPPAAEMVVTSSKVAAGNADTANPEITNNQTVGVDEGGIVKQIGRFLVVLQDGRVFSIDLGRGASPEMRLADRVDVYRSPQVAASWYDEMLVLGDRILVTAYNYRERASEITVLRLGPEGRIRREGRYLLSSNDYYSTENYATRLVGDNLVFYAPFALGNGERFEWPRLRRADGDGEADSGKAMLRATDVYAPPGEVDYPVLHTVSVCPLRAGMQCRTTGFVGPWMREFYVSPTDAYVWIGAPDGLPWSIEYGNQRRKCPPNQYWRNRARESALLYKLPLNGGPIGAIAAEGVPADQFAFEADKGRFRALLARTEPGCGSWGSSQPLVLMDVPLSAFGPAVRHVAERAYTSLPRIEGGQLENRFIGDWLVYGGRESWGSFAPDDKRLLTSSLFAVPLASPRNPTRIALPHNAIRIERAGNDAVVTGYRNAEGLSLSYVGLGRAPRLASTTLLPGRFESEGRSHAFNAWVRGDGSGLIGIPTSRREWRSGRGWSDSSSSELSFIALDTAKRLESAGELAPGDSKVDSGYSCQVSCIDWYGNSRPIFTGGRIFALMGTSLVEGEMRRGRIGERGRVDLTGRLR
jgi:hypothetical protein